MKTLIIGFGHLGKCLTAEFRQNGQEVVVMDCNAKSLSYDDHKQKIDFVHGDATKNEDLGKLPWSEINEVYVCIKEKESVNLLSSLLLESRGIDNVNSVYTSDLQSTVLKLKGIQVLDTEAEVAKLIAAKALKKDRQKK